MPVDKNEKADYICLGHFDMMHISKLGELTQKPLLEIQKDRDNLGENGFGCSENYVYSLYLLKGLSPADEKSVKSFWESNSTYTVVTRIHCDYPIDWNKEKSPFSTIIEDYCTAQIQESARVVYHMPGNGKRNCVITFCGAVNQAGISKTDVHCLFYDSLELGDTVSIMKSNSITAILEAIRCISSNRCVRDTYTYCGIDRKLIQDSSVDVSSYVVKDAELTHISTRFSVRDVKNANIFFRELKKTVTAQSPQFYVTGTADRSIQWSVCKEEQLIEIMRALTKQSADMHWCFNDVITRIGIGQDIDGSSNEQITKIGKPNIGQCIPHFYTTAEWLRDELINNTAINWKYTLLKLLGTLETMYTNYVMDDLADLIIPSVRAFLERLNHLREKNGGCVSDEYDEEIIQFLNWWTNLTNDISLLESQLTQHPELSPVRYYIPAMVLQFEMRFVEYCCKALSVENSRSFAPMLLPVDTSDLFTLCPLDPRQENYTLSCPLVVFIPFKDLYRPWETAFRIAHEMAHYCEDPSRERIERFHILVKCTALYITKYWYQKYIGQSDTGKTLYKISCQYADTLCKTFEDSINLDYPNEQWYLSQAIIVLTCVAQKAILSDQYLEQYLFNTNSEFFFKRQKDYASIRREISRPSECLIQQDNFELHLKLLKFLCEECYADIAMVQLTACDFEDYYASVYRDEYSKFEKMCPYEDLIKEPYVMRQVVRMALVIQSINEVKNCNKTWLVNNITTRYGKNLLINCAVEMIKESKGSGTTNSLTNENINAAEFASKDDFQLIGTYLSKCANKLSKELGDTKSMRYQSAQSVRMGIRYVKDSAFDWENIQKYILER